MKESANGYKRIVIKIGASLIYAGDNRLDSSFLSAACEQVCNLVNEGKEIVIVSSGAIALGMSVLNILERPKDLATLQAAAAVGQHELMSAYRRVFKERGCNCAQILLTWEDFNNRSRYLNAKNTTLTLLKFKSIPVINENDTVSTDEIKFGDNDRLSALVSNLINADLLVILSDVDGLLGNDKQVISVVDRITPQIKKLACPTDKKACVGGMITKIEAAKMAMDAGIPCVIVNGNKKDIIRASVNQVGSSGTLFIPKKESLAAKKRWIAFGAKAKGIITVDEGAKAALKNGKSLLAVGVVACEGAFNAGDIVILKDKENSEFARGKARLTCEELKAAKGKRIDKEVIHRDNIVIL